MNSNSDLFSSTNQDSPSGEMLKERLYPHSSDPLPACIEAIANDDHQALEELRRLAMTESSFPQMRTTVAGEHDGSINLEQRIRAFQQKHTSQMQRYLEGTRQRSILPDNSLFIFNGWGSQSNSNSIATFDRLTEESRQSHGGHYIRWENRGIVLNPGPDFMLHFHRQGFSIRDIDFVIVTRNHPDAYSDVKTIYELSSQLNKCAGELQIIHYYLQQQAYQELSHLLKPTSKQAKHTIHKLEMFPDSPDVETIELDDGITLNYFLSMTCEQLFRPQRHFEGFSKGHSSALGIRLELYNEANSIRLGYLSGMGWSPLLAHHLGPCEVLLAGFGNTLPTDYSRLSYNEDCLGYYGCYTLLHEVNPHLLLLTEFGGREGDIRLEIVKKIRADRNHDELCSLNQTAILPADIGLTIDLHSLKAHCSMTQHEVPSNDLCVVASASDFGQLQYLSPTFCI